MEALEGLRRCALVTIVSAGAIHSAALRDVEDVVHDVARTVERDVALSLSVPVCVLLVGSDACMNPSAIMAALGRTAPVLVVAASSLAAWLDAGAVDAVFIDRVATELRPRIAALFRRSGTYRCTNPALRLDANARLVARGDVEASLTGAEFAIFELLHDRIGQWLRSKELLAAASDAVHLDTTLVRVHVRHIRVKLRPLGCKIDSRRTLGYRLASHHDESIKRR